MRSQADSKDAKGCVSPLQLVLPHRPSTFCNRGATAGAYGDRYSA
jgi:hypothetical protein